MLFSYIYLNDDVNELQLLRPLLELGQPKRLTIQDIWRKHVHKLEQITNPHIMRYILDNAYIAYDSELAIYHLERASSSKIAKILLHLIGNVVASGHSAVLNLLLTRFRLANADMEELFGAYSSDPRGDVARVLLSHSGYTYLFLLGQLTEQLEESSPESRRTVLIIHAIDRYHGWEEQDLTRVFDLHPELKVRIGRLHAMVAVKSGESYLPMLQFLMNNLTDPNGSDDEIMSAAIRTRNSVVLVIVLSNPHIDPTANELIGLDKFQVERMEPRLGTACTASCFDTWSSSFQPV